jgi:FKBP-type peptidyl-prolyl cis-trans isomerase FklB
MRKNEMKYYVLVMMAAGAALKLMAAEDNSLVKTPKDKISYSIGMDIGRNITNQAIEINPDALAAGLKAMVTGGKPLLTEAEFAETMKTFRADMQAKMMAKRQEAQAKQAEQSKELGDKNKKDGEAFLAENKKKDGVKTTPSGLQYKVIVAGTGKIPSATDTVVTQYRGTFVDGKEFDSSYKREPFVTQVSGVIKGWSEALTMMPVGSKWQLFIPSDLAYGAGQRGIPPNSTLLFDMELLSIQDKAKEEKPK